jgi:hypothetical protein
MTAKVSVMNKYASLGQESSTITKTMCSLMKTLTDLISSPSKTVLHQNAGWNFR